MKGKTKTRQISVKVSEELHGKIEAAAIKDRRKIADLVRCHLEDLYGQGLQQQAVAQH